MLPTWIPQCKTLILTDFYGFHVKDATNVNQAM